jgi:hypothetical protein
MSTRSSSILIEHVGPNPLIKLHRLTMDQPTPHHDGRIDKRRSTTHDQYMSSGFSQLVNQKFCNYKHPKEAKARSIDSSTRSHQDGWNSRFIDLIDPASDYLLDQLNFFLNQLRLRWRQYSILDSHHIKTTVDSLKSEHAPDWLHIISGQLWSFKLVEDVSNRPHVCLDYHSVLKDGSHDQSEQDVKDFFEESSVTHRWDTSIYKTKIESRGWYFHIEHITNPITSVKTDAEQEDEAPIMPEMKSLILVQTEGSNRQLPISR